MITIGILALQGAFAEHQTRLQNLRLKHKITAPLVKTPEDLQRCDALIIPGGESTTIALLARLSGLLEPLKEFIRVKPVWGTCAGAILLSQSVTNAKKDGQELLGGIDVDIARNGWGSQVESFEAPLDVNGLSDPSVPFTGIFIRAPVVLGLSTDAPIRIIARLPPHLLPEPIDDPNDPRTIVALRQGLHLLTTFHPELTQDDRFHDYFARHLCDCGGRRTLSCFATSTNNNLVIADVSISIRTAHSPPRKMLSGVLLALSVLGSLAGTNARKMMTKAELHARQAEAAKRFQRIPRANAPATPKVKNITFTNPKASAAVSLIAPLEFYVDGTTIPEVDFDVGPSWSGLLPISSDPNETRKLFFWFFPPGPEGSLDDLIFWTNGGPGCSSLEGLLQENGPFSWSWGTAKPIVNVNSWTNLSSILYLEQPVGTDDLASQVVGFMQQFLEVFSELKGKKLYVSGESVDIANFIYENPTLLDLSLQGIWIADPVLGWDVVQSEIPVVDFVRKYQNVFAFNNSFMAELDAIAAKCNYAGYYEKFATFPPAGPLPLPGKSTSADRGCDIWETVFEAALVKNPAFNIYRIFDTFPILWDVLGFPGSFENIQLAPLYFDRADVKKAIHAPANVQWSECSDVNVFPRGDASLPSSFTVLPNVIEKSPRTVIVHGLADFILIAEGARNGLQGFQTPIQDDSFLVDGVGPLGTAHTERNLTFLEVELSGHMTPQFSPLAAFQSMQFLMGFRSTP
ncbi:alpha/beta-hydrolase [Favolaschia claudopus]|uniref:glutaminase n=1 Tax=Favolaschia claudopus TaxID=2862362 RepID=A0AAW0DQ96_9AGAR